ncbi:IclR family transcriptional regulator [Streptomyces sp. NPDC059373]
MSTTEHVPGTSGVQVITRAAEIMRTLQAVPGGMTQTELVEHIGLAKSTVHRLLNALEEEGLVESSGPRGRYWIGSVVRRMADTARQGLVAQIHPLLEELSREVFETVDLSALDRNHVTFIDQVVVPHRLQAVSAVGESYPLHCTANGKAYLAAMSARELAAVLPDELPAHTARTITDRAALERELQRVRDEGVAYDIEEHTEGVCSVSRLIHGPLGVPFAVGIPLPAQRFHGRELLLRDALVGWAARVEQHLDQLG